MPKMRGEKSGTTHHGFSGKDFEKELASQKANFKYPSSNAKEVKDVSEKGVDPLLQWEWEHQEDGESDTE
ncbi:MAG: hypothetical protein ACLQGU_06790 [bacterium]